MSVAAVLVDTGLAHLDRPFEYTVPDDLVDVVTAGVRVKVRFSGRDLDGFVVAVRPDGVEHRVHTVEHVRRAGGEHGELALLRRGLRAVLLTSCSS